MRLITWILLSACPLLVGCGPGPDSAAPSESFPVRLVTPTQSSSEQLQLSGVVRAEVESALAFQVGGLVQERLVNAGTEVVKGQALMRLDPRDLEQQLQVEQAAFEAAQAQQQLAAAELQRVQQLRQQQLVSEQLLDQAQLALTQAQKSVNARQASFQIAKQAFAYGTLTAPADGVVLSFSADQGQVVNRGQAVALFAHNGARDIEVLLPPLQQPAPQAQLQLGELILPLTLRETAAALSESGRTLAVRYSVQGALPLPLPLNSVVQVSFNAETAPIWVVPLSALDGRCAEQNGSNAGLSACPLSGGQLWRAVNGTAQPLPARVLRVDGEYAYIEAALQPGEQIIGAGTHRLTRGAAVRVLPQ